MRPCRATLGRRKATSSTCAAFLLARYRFSHRVVMLFYRMGRRRRGRRAVADGAGWRRRVTYVGASLVLIVAITATYHLGVAQYRQDGVKQPEIGNTLISVPMLLSVNPLGSIADHAAMQQKSRSVSGFSGT